MAADGNRHILALGGISRPAPRGMRLPSLLGYALGLSGSARPRVCVLDTAGGDDQRSYADLYPRLVQYGAVASRLQLFPRPNVSDPQDLLLSQDVILVGDGSLANLLALWRLHGLERVLRRGWAAGIVLAGVGAGAMCWFDGGPSDSFGLPLRPQLGGVGLLPGSFCPHYSQEAGRRPSFHRAIGDGTLPAGIGCDDDAAAHYAGDHLAAIVASRPAATGYQVWPEDGTAAEDALPAELLEPSPPGRPRNLTGPRSARRAAAAADGGRRPPEAPAPLEPASARRDTWQADAAP